MGVTVGLQLLCANGQTSYRGAWGLGKQKKNCIVRGWAAAGHFVTGIYITFVWSS